MSESSEKHEAMQAVVDRVSAYQDGATEGTTEKELRAAFAETDLEVTDEQVHALVEAIEQDPGSVHVSSVLG